MYFTSIQTVLVRIFESTYFVQEDRPFVLFVEETWVHEFAYNFK